MAGADRVHVVGRCEPPAFAGVQQKTVVAQMVVSVRDAYKNTMRCQSCSRSRLGLAPPLIRIAASSCASFSRAPVSLVSRVPGNLAMHSAPFSSITLAFGRAPPSESPGALSRRNHSSKAKISWPRVRDAAKTPIGAGASRPCQAACTRMRR